MALSPRESAFLPSLLWDYSLAFVGVGSMGLNSNPDASNASTLLTELSQMHIKYLLLHLTAWLRHPDILFLQFNKAIGMVAPTVAGGKYNSCSSD